MQRRSILKAAAGAATTLAVPQVFAQPWPSGPIRIIVGFPPGGGTDALARVLSVKLTQMWNQQVIVENKAGVAGVLAADYVAQQASDGTTLLMAHINSHALAPSLQPKLNYSVERDFVPIVLVGVTGLELSRADFYEKELSFQVSCSYGPGRYDPAYEEKGNDYPVGFVRWTEQRNFEAVLDMLACGLLNTKPLVTHRFALDDAHLAYDALTNEQRALGMLLVYGRVPPLRQTPSVALATPTRFDPQRPVLGFIGAGNYASRILIPAFKAAGAQFHTLVASGGISAVDRKSVV